MTDKANEMAENDTDLGRLALPDDDFVLAKFFAGQDLTGPVTPDGGKGLQMGAQDE